MAVIIMVIIASIISFGSIDEMIFLSRCVNVGFSIIPIVLYDPNKQVHQEVVVVVGQHGQDALDGW